MDLNLVDQIHNALPDCRKPGYNQKYAVTDTALSAFSVFFTQSPSFLDYQQRMQKHRNRNNAKQELVYRNAWATSHAIDEHNVMHIVAAARARWKVENENNNVLKNQGYHFEHTMPTASSIYPTSWRRSTC